jgi:hypothetical protein
MQVQDTADVHAYVRAEGSDSVLVKYIRHT